MRRFRDREGDVWTEQSDGSYVITETGTPYNLGSEGSFEWVQSEYGPLTELDPSPTDLSAPATRGDLVKVLEVLFHMGDSVTASELVSKRIDEIKEGRA